MSKKPPAMVDFKFSEDTIDEPNQYEDPSETLFPSEGMKLELEDDEDRFTTTITKC
jgi:hypothetical protein